LNNSLLKTAARKFGRQPDLKEDKMLIPHGAHVMVVDGAKMALFRNSGKDFAPHLDLVEEKEKHTPRTSSLGSDKPGRGFQSMGSERAAYETSDFHQLAEDAFAAEAAERLASLLKGGKERAVLVAAPRALGVMRKNLKPAVRARLIAEIDKDYAGRSAAEITQMLGSLEH
jgi:protein required for attachment to host cells